MKRSISLAALVVAALGLMACAAHPLQRVDAPSASDPTAYPPQAVQKPLPPPGYDPTLQAPTAPVPPPAPGADGAVPPPPPPPPQIPQTVPTPVPGQ